MASNSYFSLLPNFQYINPTQVGGKKKQYVEAKNLFLRLKLRDAVSPFATNFQKYSIREDQRPDSIAEELYGDSNFDWVVLITANIINVKDEWPLSSRLLYEVMYDKYEENLNSVRHYETKEIRDSKDRLLLPGGKVVDSTFRIPNPDSPGQEINPTVAVSNWLVEVRKNNEKRTIKVLKKAYLTSFVNEARDFLQYQESSQYNRQTGLKVAFDNF
jgi:hypothetical protein|tara:strand:- start:29863 stop:30510 length:648 start_codon:yes stop_codon:yes gene_type:complete